MTTTKYDWTIVQKFYDLGNSSRDCCAQFGMTFQAFNSARRSGVIRTRNLSQSASLRSKNKPSAVSDSTRQKHSENLRIRHQNGLAHTLGHNRNRQEPSYPEKWWRTVLDNELQDQNFVAEFRFHRYSIDFAWPEKKIALEIDGDQHRRFESQKASDLRKDTVLKDHGWIVFRVPWKECMKDPKKFIQQVQSLVDNNTKKLYKSDISE